TLTILHRAGSVSFDALIAQLDRGLPPIAENGASAKQWSALSVVPRDAALVLRFDDLLDASTITASNESPARASPRDRARRSTRSFTSVRPTSSCASTACTRSG